MPFSVLRLDMRAPAFSSASARDLYAAGLEMAAWADRQGFAMVSLSEHHGVEDGYLPSPLTFAGCIVGCTDHLRIGVTALLLPLYDPVRLAEDLIVLDLASGGRVSLTLGLGYRRSEYEMLGVDWDARGRVMDECVETLLAALRGERFEYRGRSGVVTPRPFTRPHPPLSIGGTGRNAARRAARFGLPFHPSTHIEEVFALYRAECERLGATPVVVPPGRGEMIWVSEDPDRTWERIGPHLVHQVTTYASWQPKGQLTTVVDSAAESAEALRAEGKYRVLTPDECVAYAREVEGTGGIVLYPLCGGTPPEIGWESLELYASKVLPQLA